jgi:hypothetical protein
MKINVVKVANIAGTVLGIAGTLLTGWAGQKAAKETIAKQVAEAVAEQMNK